MTTQKEIRISLIDFLEKTCEIALWISMIAYIFSRALLLVGIYTAVICWLLIRILQKKPFIPKTGANLYLFIILATLILSISFGGNWSEGLRGLHKWVRGFFILWFSYDFFQNEKRERRVMQAITLALLIACIDGIAQFFLHRDLIRNYPVGLVNDGQIRLTSSFGYFGMFASFLLMATPIAIAYATRLKKKWFQVILITTLLLISLVNLYLTRTRGACISMFGAILIFLWIRQRWQIIFLLIAALSIAPFVLPKNIVFHHQKAVGFDQTISHRIALWQEAANIIKARPLTGCGLNTYAISIEKYNPPHEHEVKNYYAHNGYLQHAAETGLLGLGVFLSLTVYYLSLIFRYRSQLRKDPLSIQMMLILSMSGFLFYMLFDTIFHNLQPFLLFWFLLGWSLSYLDPEARGRRVL